MTTANASAVNGGRDYFRTNMAGVPVTIDLLTDDITVIKT